MRASLLVVLLLAGCAAPPQEATTTENLTAPTTASTPASTEAAPAEEATVAAPPAEDRTRIVVVEDTAKITVAFGAPCVSGVRPCSRGPMSPARLSVTEAGAASGVLVVTWEPSSPADDMARVGVRAAEAEVAAAEGVSPLTLTLPPEALERPVDLTVMVEPAVGKAFVQQEATVVLTLTYA